MTNAEKIKQLFDENRPVMLGGIAKELGISALEAAHLLPEGVATFAPGAAFDHVWESIATWEKATFIVEHMGNVFEVSTPVALGKHAMGYYNIMGGKAPLEGHFKADLVREIGFISIPFMGRESHFAAFFNHDGDIMYSFYVGREKHVLIPEAREAFLALKASYKDPKTLIVYSSQTGNTKRIAEAVCKGAPCCVFANVDQAPAPDAFDRIFVGFWIDKGLVDEKARAYLERIKGKVVAPFCTMGGNPEEERAKAFVEKFEADLVAGDAGNTYKKLFVSQGKVTDEVIEAMNRMLGDKANDPARLARLAEAAKHPDKNDCLRASEWAASVIGE